MSQEPARLPCAMRSWAVVRTMELVLRWKPAESQAMRRGAASLRVPLLARPQMRPHDKAPQYRRHQVSSSVQWASPSDCATQASAIWPWLPPALGPGAPGVATMWTA